MSVYIIKVRNVLVGDFAKKKKAATLFLPLLTDTSIRNAVKQFQSHIKNVIADTNDVYACCSLFMSLETSTLLTKVYPEFVSAIEAAIIVNDNFNCCGRTDYSSHFCNTYYDMIIGEQIPKFRSANCINVLLCQKYPDILSDLTHVKEAFITCTHPIKSVIKLRPSGTGSTASYHWI